MTGFTSAIGPVIRSEIKVGFINHLPTGPTFLSATFPVPGPGLGTGTGKLCTLNGTCSDVTLTPRGCPVG